MTTARFHLSFPVSDLQRSLCFYQAALRAHVGRRTDGWVDVWLYGHQLTLHQRPEQVWPASAQGVRHFGLILSWAEWQRLAADLRAAGIEFQEPPTPVDALKHAKLLLQDPDGHLIEMKLGPDPPALIAAATD